MGGDVVTPPRPSRAGGRHCAVGDVPAESAPPDSGRGDGADVSQPGLPGADVQVGCLRSHPSPGASDCLSATRPSQSRSQPRHRQLYRSWTPTTSGPAGHSPCSAPVRRTLCPGSGRLHSETQGQIKRLWYRRSGSDQVGSWNWGQVRSAELTGQPSHRARNRRCALYRDAGGRVSPDGGTAPLSALPQPGVPSAEVQVGPIVRRKGKSSGSGTCGPGQTRSRVRAEVRLGRRS